MKDDGKGGKSKNYLTLFSFLLLSNATATQAKGEKVRTFLGYALCPLRQAQNPTI